MNQLLTFLAIAIIFPLGTLTLFGLLTPRGEATRRAWEHRDWTERVSAERNVGFTDAHAPQPLGPQDGLSAQAQAAMRPITAKKPPSIPASQSERSTERDDAVAALITLKIPKRQAAAFVRQAAGTTTAEIVRNALRIRGQGRGPAL